MADEPSTKRPRTDSPPPADPPVETNPADDDTSSDDDDIGPSLPTAPSGAPRPAKKKRKTISPELQKLYLSTLPTQPRYSKSLMHRDTLFTATMTPYTDFLITTSVDGVVKFWKKNQEGIEFVKAWRPHTEPIASVSVSADGQSFATAAKAGGEGGAGGQGGGNEGKGKVTVWDVVTFDLLSTIQLEYEPASICWVHGRGAVLPLLAVADKHSPTIRVYDTRRQSAEPVWSVDKLHRAPVHLMAFNPKYNTIVSADESGMVEYWTPRPEHNFEKTDDVFKFKSDTSLFEFKKAKSVPTSITLSPTGEHFATFSHPDRLVRVFSFRTGKLHRVYDESLTTLTTLHQASVATNKPSDLDFNRKMAVETSLSPSDLRTQSILFDETGTFLIYGSLGGIKILNMTTNRLARVLAHDENIRPLNLTLYQGAPQKKQVVTIEMAASSNPLLEAADKRDPMLVATAHGKERFYIFDNTAEVHKSERDIINEKLPSSAGASSGQAGPTHTNPSALPEAAILHTSLGDIHLRLFPEAAPKTVENFTTHARNGYYNNTIFHRVIKKFMVQAGDPLGDGTGGESIWGGEFEDEFSSLKHDKPYTLSSANRGRNTNGSQWFITTEKTPWLDGIHTIFGRAIRGLDVIHKIENARTDKKDKPEEDVKIISITVL